MINILLVCYHGASTSLVETKIAEAAEKQGLEVLVRADPIANLGENIEDADIVLLGPQVSYRFEKIKQAYPSKANLIMVIDSIDYGMMDGETILKKALALLANNQ